MGHFQHDLQKATHLWSNLATMRGLHRVMTKEDKKRIKQRFARRQAKRRSPKVPLANLPCIYTFKIDPTTKCLFQLVRLQNDTKFALSEPQVYWTSSTRADGKKSWQGGKHLAETAVFTQDFCNHLLQCWEARLDPAEISDSD